MGLTASKLWALAAAAHPKLPKGWSAEVAFFQSYELEGFGGPVEATCDASFEDGQVWLTVSLYAPLKILRSAKFTQFEAEVGAQLRAAGFEEDTEERLGGDAQDAVTFERYLSKAEELVEACSALDTIFGRPPARKKKASGRDPAE
jgi:hypothetical protein